MKRRERQRGFAMLLVFAMAAAVAIMLYMELPRAAFEAQRHRELLLIDRGEQYQRAIQLYFRKTRQFPANLEQLENTNGFRFLRRRYKDPITGKDEWRLIHIGPGGMLTDSLTQKPPGLKTDKEKEEKAEGTGEPGKAGELPSAATRRRASEMAGPGLPGSMPPGGVAGPGAEPQPGQEGQPPWAAAQAIYPPPGQAYPQPDYPQPPNPEPQAGEPFVVAGQQTVQPGQPYPVPGAQPGQPYPVITPAQVQTVPQPGQVFPATQPGLTVPSVQPGQVIPGLQPGQVYPVIQPGQASPVIQPGQVYPVVQPGQVYPGGQPGQVYPGMPQTTPYPPQQAVTSPGVVQVYPGSPGQPPPQFIQSILTPGGRPGRPARPGMQSPEGQQFSQPPAAPYPTPAQPPTGASPSNPALEMIRKILTTPRPGGAGQAEPQQTFSFGAGIAGVASKAEADSIIIYNERSRYNEWEFIYDLRKDRTMIGPVGPGGVGAGALLQPPQGSSQTTPMAPSLTSPGGRGR